ncbi:hypothetical protein CPT_Suzuki_043 [Stenotrophomonas phage Suzuki]|nr:hypothetical protein CPT_Suzuki_043 [Stenotrophomonas phage Suzuki]
MTAPAAGDSLGSLVALRVASALGSTAGTRIGAQPATENPGLNTRGFLLPSRP